MRIHINERKTSDSKIPGRNEYEQMHEAKFMDATNVKNTRMKH